MFRDKKKYLNIKSEGLKKFARKKKKTLNIKSDCLKKCARIKKVFQFEKVNVLKYVPVYKSFWI